MQPSLRYIDNDSPAPLEAKAVVVVGNFDGVHRGHVAVLEQALALGRERGLVPIVLTFNPHPAAVVGKGARPTLTSLTRKAELLARYGVGSVVVRTFDLAFAAWSPARFAADLLAHSLCAKIVMVGENFRFGAKRAGDFAGLEKLGEGLGFEARAHGIAGDGVGPFSSTRAREAIARGDLEGAETVLGRPHALSGVVVHGQARGRTIGFPTANLEAIEEMLAPDGVYAVIVDELTGSGARALAGGVMNIGVRPTVGGGLARTVEAHLFDVSRDLYGAKLRVHLVARLRGEAKFSNFEALKAQIAKDASKARALVTPLTSAARAAGSPSFG